MSTAAVPADAAPSRHPVHLRVDDDLSRSRLTVFFRVLLTIPHVLVLALFVLVAVVLLLVGWIVALFAGRVPDGIHNLLARTLRYSTHVTAYVYLLADPFPPFGGREAYAVDLEVDSPEPQSRLTVLFRAFLAIPALIIASVLGNLLGVLGFLGWFVCLALGRMPEGMRNLGAFCLRYSMQTYAYLFLLTKRYPSLSFPKPE